MKKIWKRVLIAAGILIGFILAGSVCLILFGNGSISLPVTKKDIFSVVNYKDYPKTLRVRKNIIVDADGDQVLLRGIMLPDLQKVDSENRFTEKYLDKVFTLGTNVIRVPVHPDRWVNDEYYLWRYLDKVVAWAGKQGQYVIIDLHFIGNIKNGSGSQMVNVGGNPENFSVEFWNKVAAYFKDAPNVIFEIYNEPASILSSDWAVCAQKLVDTIRNTGAKQLIIVGGIDYSYDLSWVLKNPVADDNIAYAAHIFPNRANWDSAFSKIAASYPIVVTEWGYIAERENAKQKYLIGTRKSYGQPLVNYMNEHEMGWVACWYDDNWEPPMFTDDFAEYTDWGRFVSEQLKTD